MDIPTGLLKHIKTRVGITWDDNATDESLRGIVEEGIEYIENKRGAPSDFEVAGAPRRILVEYCRYARADALDVFEANYLTQIIAMQNDRAVESYA